MTKTAVTKTKPPSQEMRETVALLVEARNEIEELREELREARSHSNQHYRDMERVQSLLDATQQERDALREQRTQWAVATFYRRQAAERKRRTK